MNTMKTAEEIRLSVNEYSARGESFVFGLDYKCEQGFFFDKPFERTDLFWEMDGTGNASSLSETWHGGTRFEPRYIPYEEYERAFGVIRGHLMRGDTFLANLTMRTPVVTDYSLEEIFHRSRSRFRILSPGRFVCFSPEIFVNINAGGTISCHPMKGTISGLLPDAERIILSDYKETAEHITIVDFIRSDLSRVARNVRVKRLRYIDTLTTSRGPVLQVSSEICGDLPDDWRKRLGDILFALLPAGSISGAPKVATVRAIAEAECHDRGFYTGIFGYFNGIELKTAVMIRFIERVDNDGLFFHSGGGITINSLCRDEYEEMCQKVYVPW